MHVLSNPGCICKKISVGVGITRNARLGQGPGDGAPVHEFRRRSLQGQNLAARGTGNGGWVEAHNGRQVGRSQLYRPAPLTLDQEHTRTRR